MKLGEIKTRLKKFCESNFRVFVSIAVLILFTYFQSLKFDFTGLDDYDLILNKFHILSRIENLPVLFKTNLLMSESGIYYRPLISLSFMIDAIIGGKSAFVFHLSNIIYHFIASILFFLLFNLIAENKIKSFLFSLIFAVHPSLSQAVVWIPGRNDILLFIFLALTIIFFDKFLNASAANNPKRLFFLVLCSISFLLSLFTKENTILILLFIFLYTSFIKSIKTNRKSKLTLIITFSLPLLIYFIFRMKAQIQETELERIPIPFIDYVKGFVNYIGKVFMPFNLSVITLPENINLIYGFISLAAIITLSLLGIKNSRIFLFGTIWFVLFLISGIVGLTGFTNFLDHRLYVPIFGIFLAISQIKFFEKVSENILILFILLTIFFFVYLNIIHSKNFQNPLSFYTSAVESAPNSFFTQRGLANVYHKLKDYDKAEKHYQKSLSFNPNSVETLVNAGINFKKKGNLDSAEFYFLRALRINPVYSVTYNNLGNLYLQKNKLPEAEFYLKKAIELNPNYFEAHNNLGVLYARMKREVFAYKHFYKSIEINQDFAEGYFNLALLFFNKNEIDSSKFYYKKAVERGFPQKNILGEKLKELN